MPGHLSYEGLTQSLSSVGNSASALCAPNEVSEVWGSELLLFRDAVLPSVCHAVSPLHGLLEPACPITSL